MPECVAKITVEVRIDARIDSGREVAEPGEGEDDVRWDVTLLAEPVGEVGAEEGQPKDDEGDKHPDEGPLCAPLTTVYLKQRDLFENYT